MSEFVELQKRIEKCAEIYDVIRRGSWTSTESLGLGSVGIGIPLDSVSHLIRLIVFLMAIKPRLLRWRSWGLLSAKKVL